MGGLRHKMPITFLTMWIGTLALIGFPGFSGFFSKDMIIEAVRRSTTPGSGFAYLAVLSGVFVTAFYSFRLLFMTFMVSRAWMNTSPRIVHESPWVVTVPLILLAIPSVVIGLVAFEPLLIQNFFGASIKVAPDHDVVARFARDYHGIGPFVAHGFQALLFFLAAGGFGLAWLFYIRSPHLPGLLATRAKFLYTLLLNKYYADEANEFAFARVPAPRPPAVAGWRRQADRRSRRQRHGPPDRLGVVHGPLRPVRLRLSLCLCQDRGTGGHHHAVPAPVIRHVL